MISKIRTRKLAVTILALIVISSVAPIGLFFVRGAATAKFPFEVVVDNGDSTTDTLRLADHTSSADGNWIELIGTDGDVINLPNPIEVEVTSSVDTQSFTYKGKPVTIDTAFTWPKTVIYPHATHKVYHLGDVVEMEFTSSVTYTGDTVELRLVQGTLNGVRNVVTEALQGNIEPLKDYLHDNEVDIGGPITETLTGGNSFSFTHNFGALGVGDYVAVVLVESGYGGAGDYQLDLYSLTPIEVLDYELTVSPSYNDVQENLEVEVTVEGATGSSYSYGTVLVKQDIYSLYAEVNTDGTLTGTTVDVGVDSGSTLYRVVENQQFLGVSLSDYSDMISQSFWESVLSDLETQGVLTAGDVKFGLELQTSSSSLTGLDAIVLDASDCQGTYYLMTIVWEHGGGNIAGFDQQEVSIGAGATFDTVSSDLPQAYANLVTISYDVTSQVDITGANLQFEASIGGVPVPESTKTVSIDLTTGANSLTYEWDTLLDVPKSYKTGGTVSYTLTLFDDSMVELDSTSGSGEMTAASKGSVFTGRLNGLASEWSLSTPAEKGVLFNTYLNPLASLWAEL